ncbi:MAG: VWA domain-containing protein [Planctomycetota bacterium]
MTDFLGEFHFLRPWWLLTTPVVVLVFWWIHRMNAASRGFEKQIAPHLARHLTVEAAHQSRFTPKSLLAFLWLLSTLVLAGPAARRQPSPFADDTATLVIVIHVSDSMLNADLPPSRLELARDKLATLLERRGNAPTGLVAYDGTAHLVMPATKDAEVINHMLQALDPKIMPSEGDALDEAIAIANHQLFSTQDSGSILIVTDSATGGQVNDQEDAFSIQFLALARDDAALQATGIPKLATKMNASVQMVTSDDRDIDRVLNRSKQSVVEASLEDATAWRDDGYYFTPLILLGGLMWARRGWSIES